MAGVNDRALRGAGPWPLGVVNAIAEDAMPRDENGRPLGLRAADNVDLDPVGTPSRRRGAEQFYAGTLAHSLWTDDRLPFGLFVDNGSLHAIDASGAVTDLAVPVGHLPLSFELIGERVFYCNRATSGMIDMALQRHEWGPETPGGQPTLAAADGYALPAGQYQVAVTFLDALGRESGTAQAATIDLAAGQGIALSDIPQPVAAVAVAVFLTDANDQVLRLHSVLPTGTTTAVLGQRAKGRALETQFLRPMPPGQIVGLLNGRHFVADGRNLRWSPPLRYGLTDPVRNVLRFADDIDLFAPVGEGASGGVFVAAGARTHFLAGADPAGWSLNIRRPAGAIPGSYARIPANVFGSENTERVPVWVATDGHVCIGGPGGSITLPKQGLAVLDGADRAAALFREEAGLQQYVVAMRGPRPQSLMVRDQAIAHVIYDGTAPGAG